MISRTRPSFWRAYARLSEPTRFAARRAYVLFDQNPDHPSLRFKKLSGYENVWSVRVNEQYRAIGERRGDTIVWVWIGTHNEFDNLFGWRREKLSRKVHREKLNFLETQSWVARSVPVAMFSVSLNTFPVSNSALKPLH